MKVLVIRFSSIGDIILTSPVIRALKLQLNAEVHFVTKSQYNFVFQANPYIDKHFVLEGSVFSLAEKLKAEKYDYVVDLHNNLRSRLLCRLLRKPNRAFPKLNLKKWIWINLKINSLPDQHIVERYFEAARDLGLKPDGMGLDYHIPDPFVVKDFQYRFVSFVVGGQHFTKRLPVEKAVEAIAKIPFPVMILGGKEDREVGEQIASYFFDKEVLNLCGRYNFHQSASLVAQSLAVFTNDTGLMHVAAAFGKKTFVFWGNTSPKLGMYPYKTEHINLENNNLSCRPCSKIGYNRCPKGHFRCMKDLLIDFEL
jgi:ADP-heptose:LPS heptosyltransferase